MAEPVFSLGGPGRGLENSFENFNFQKIDTEADFFFNFSIISYFFWFLVHFEKKISGDPMLLSSATAGSYYLRVHWNCDFFNSLRIGRVAENIEKLKQIDWNFESLFFKINYRRIIFTLSDYIYEEILKFAADKQPTKLKRPPLLRQESIHLSPKKRLPHDPRTGKSKLLELWLRVTLYLLYTLY